MSTIALPSREVPAPTLIAPVWHTAALIALFLLLTLAGAFFQKAATAQPGMVQHSGVIPLYVSTLVVEWGLVYYVWKGGLRRRGVRLRDLVGGRWSSPADVLRDLFLAAGIWGVWKLVQVGWDHWIGPEQAASISPLLPRGPAEILLWVLVSITAGICEEVVFRGYFLRQFTAFTRNRGAGLALQAALFGIAHGYQGTAACARIACYGLIFGGMALWRGSLRPGIFAHAGSDILSGIFRF